ncbi:MAG: hypothetical protein LBL15_01360 [Oscillospiraceae bacterium]|jgi:hypothetical protein|nr:hypothetical protein [Oscillospiraceae bacterium]
MIEKAVCAANTANTVSCRESVCIHTRKTFDSCRDKDCVEDLRVYPTVASQAIIDATCNIRPGAASLIYCDVRVEELNFNRGCYTVDITYFYKVTGRAFPGDRTVTGLAIFDKRVVLYGSEGSSKVFTSNGENITSSLPVAVCEVVDPLMLGIKICDSSCICMCDNALLDIPDVIMACFDDDLVTGPSAKQLFVTLGQFSITRLERDTQLLIPVYDYCIPDKECTVAGTDEDPCSLFSNIPFPVSDFFPPKGNPNTCAVSSRRCSG